MSRKTYILIAIGLCIVLAWLVMGLGRVERCIDGHAEFSGNEC